MSSTTKETMGPPRTTLPMLQRAGKRRRAEMRRATKLRKFQTKLAKDIKYSQDTAFSSIASKNANEAMMERAQEIRIEHLQNRLVTAERENLEVKCQVDLLKLKTEALERMLKLKTEALEHMRKTLSSN